MIWFIAYVALGLIICAVYYRVSYVTYDGVMGWDERRGDEAVGGLLLGLLWPLLILALVFVGIVEGIGWVLKNTIVRLLEL